jgi:hypothetical protein
VCAPALDFSQEQDFPLIKFLQNGSRTTDGEAPLWSSISLGGTERLLQRRGLLRRSSFSTEMRIFREKTGFPMCMVSWDEIAPGKSFSWEKFRAKADLDRRHFYKVLYENDLNIKNKPVPENFKLCILYTMKLSAGLPNLVRLSL